MSDLLPMHVPDEAEREAFGRLLGRAFGFEAAETTPWFERAGHDNLRVTCEGEAVAAGLLYVPMGQWVGGRSVTNAGIAGVGVRPESRRSGLATRLMVAALHELREAGSSVSTLFASSQALYRRAGYEAAGTCHEAVVRPQNIGLAERGPAVREATEDDRGAIEAVYGAVARRSPGHLDRGPYIWTRVRRHRDGKDNAGYVVEEEGRVTGYVFYRQERPPGELFYDLAVADLQAATRRAGARLWTFLADHGTMVRQLRLHSAPHALLLGLLPDQVARLTLIDSWMLRVVDVCRALEGRGYAPGLRVRLDLDVSDPQVAANDGAWRLEVEDGRARVRQGGEGTVGVSVRGLAALYTGFQSPWDLRAAGLLEGPDEALEVLEGVFAGAGPWMPDMF